MIHFKLTAPLKVVKRCYGAPTQGFTEFTILSSYDDSPQQYAIEFEAAIRELVVKYPDADLSRLKIEVS